MSRLVRSVLRSLLLVAMLSLAMLDGLVRKRFFGLRPGPAGAVWVHGWCRRIVRVLGLRFSIAGTLPIAQQPGLAVVSNHLSYLDILLYSAATPLVMVAKTEVRSWPLLGWITRQAGTVYVDRADLVGGQKQTHAEVNVLMAEAFRSGLPVLFFPEGTTTGGDSTLPFRRGLFHSVLRDRVPVRAAALAYTLTEHNQGASVGEDVCFWKDHDFTPHLFHCLGLRGVHAHLHFGDLVPGTDRFALASNGRNAVAALYRGLPKNEPYTNQKESSFALSHDSNEALLT